MPKSISFSHTSPQFLDGSKTVTRRQINSWEDLKPGTILKAIEKCQGLKKGEKQKPLGLIRVTAVRCEPLNTITQAECALEGFPEWAPADFIAFYIGKRKCSPDFVVTRIEFERIETPTA